jgi:hypothetical protein
MSVGVERYAMGYHDPRGLFGGGHIIDSLYGAEHTLKRSFIMGAKKEDAHEYITEANNLPIEVCVSMWVIKYGDGIVPATKTASQDKLMWEIGNRLWWANRLKYKDVEDTYEIIE